MKFDWSKFIGGAATTPENLSTAQSAASVLGAMQNYYPDIAGMISQTALNNAQQTAPGYAQLAWDTMYSQLPKMSWLQSWMYGKNAPMLAQAEAAADQSVLSKYGPDLVSKMLSLDQTINPEYYGMRSQAAGTIGQLMSGKLTDAENEAISRQILGGNVNRGLAGIPSNINTVSNAMLYGDAARQRQMQGAQMATSFLPVSRSGLDAQNIALGNKNWQSKFLGVNDTSGVTGASQQTQQNASKMGTDVLSGMFGLQSQNAQQAFESPTELDKVSQFTGAVGNL